MFGHLLYVAWFCSLLNYVSSTSLRLCRSDWRVSSLCVWTGSAHEATLNVQKWFSRYITTSTTQTHSLKEKDNGEEDWYINSLFDGLQKVPTSSKLKNRVAHWKLVSVGIFYLVKNYFSVLTRSVATLVYSSCIS